MGINTNEHFSRVILGFVVENYENPPNHSNFETTWLHDAFDFFNVQASYDYLLPELRPFRGSKRRGNRGTRLEIARESVFENGPGRSGDVHRHHIGAGFLLASGNPDFKYALLISVHGRLAVSRGLLRRLGRSGVRHTCCGKHTKHCDT